eukprot:52928-Alexandrium_andersonii.AAC.1
MSASLVGSEMCIRDRSESDPRPALKPQASRPIEPICCPKCKALVQPMPPVSYTHLTLPTICSV